MRTRQLTTLCALVALAGCGGGGSGTLPAAPSPAPTQAPQQTYAVSGVVKKLSAACDGSTANCNATGPANGFAVTLGAFPPSGTGGAPAAPTFSATTDANGNFSVSNIPAGTYEMQIAKDATFATLHAKVTVPASGTLSYGVSALASDEQSWFSGVNTYRSQNAAAPIVADEYAMEADRAYANYVAANYSGVCNPSCQNYAQFPSDYRNMGGVFAYSDSYRFAIDEPHCLPFAEQDTYQGPMLAQKTAVFGGYAYRLFVPGDPSSTGTCAFGIVAN